MHQFKKKADQLTCRIKAWTQPADVSVVGRVTVNGPRDTLKSDAYSNPFRDVRLRKVTRVLFTFILFAAVDSFARNSQRFEYR